MRNLKIMALVILLGLGGLLVTNRVEALPLSGAAGIGTAVKGAGIRQDAAYVCRRVWRCRGYGCGWRRSCYWRPGYAYRPHWRWRGRPRYWGRPHWRGNTWRGRRYWR